VDQLLKKTNFTGVTKRPKGSHRHSLDVTASLLPAEASGLSVGST